MNRHQNYRRNPRYRETVRRHEEGRRLALRELVALYPEVYKELLAKHKAAVNEKKGPLPTVVDEYTFREVRKK